MAIDSLKDVYIAQVRDMHSACTQSLKATRMLREVARDSDLSEALEAGVAGIERGRAAMAEIARRHGADAGSAHCRGMEGLVAEAQAEVIEEDYADIDARDAVIVTQYQRMAHYAIAGYGTILAFARRLGLQDDAATVEECLEKSRDGDRRLTEIATSGLNARAA
jgi:ferritin-like metal-binding protein YciE